MMSKILHGSFLGIVVLSSGIVASIGGFAVAQNATPENTAPQNTAFPDTNNHWAQPFVGKLAANGIVTGYPDGTFRPDTLVGRDEFAAIIRQAFNQNTERRIASGSVYRDVPNNYWAASAIEEAYEMGFMHGYTGGYFRPQQNVTRVEALVALAENLRLRNAQAATESTAQPQAVNPTPQLPVVNPIPAQTTQSQASSTAQQTAPKMTPARRQARRRGLMYPMAMTVLMQPLIASRAQAMNSPTSVTQNPTPPANVNSDPNQNNSQPNQQSVTPPNPPNSQPASAQNRSNLPLAQKPVESIVRNYYTDANQIPQYAIDKVANATKAGLVVNHPNPRILNPNRPATRAEIAAFIHQALVTEGKIAPVGNNNPTSNFIVQGE